MCAVAARRLDRHRPADRAHPRRRRRCALARALRAREDGRARPDRAARRTRARRFRSTRARVRGVARSGSRSRRAALAYLLPRLTDPDESVIVNALRGVQRIGDSTCGSCTCRCSARSLQPHSLRARHRGDRARRARSRGRASIPPAGDADRRASSRGSRTTTPQRAARPPRAARSARGDRAVASVVPLLADSSAYVRVAVLRRAHRAEPGRRRARFEPAWQLAPATPLFDRMAAAEALGAPRLERRRALARRARRHLRAHVASCARQRSPRWAIARACRCWRAPMPARRATPTPTRDCRSATHCARSPACRSPTASSARTRRARALQRPTTARSRIRRPRRARGS